VTVSVPDVTAPGTPAALSATATSATSVALTWGAADDNVGVTGYVVNRDGAFLATVPAATTSYLDAALSSDLTYGYSVISLDEAGNAAAPVDATVALVSVDTTPPTVPANLFGQPLGGRRVSLIWDASTDDRGGTIRYRIFRGTKRIATTTTTSYTDRPATVGTYRYRVRAVDAAGNVSAYTVTVSVVAVRRV
jgi:hypothetical protein